MKHVLEKKSNN